MELFEIVFTEKTVFLPPALDKFLFTPFSRLHSRRSTLFPGVFESRSIVLALFPPSFSSSSNNQIVPYRVSNLSKGFLAKEKRFFVDSRRRRRIFRNLEENGAQDAGWIRYIRIFRRPAESLFLLLRAQTKRGCTRSLFRAARLFVFH